MSSGAEKKQTTRFASLLRYASLRSADASLQGRLLLHLSTYVIVPYIYSLRPSKPIIEYETLNYPFHNLIYRDY